MNFKLRKISKLNIAMSVVMCAVLFFCFCSRPYVVQAAESALDNKALSKLHMAGAMTRSGYLAYNPDYINWDDTNDCSEGNIPYAAAKNIDGWAEFALKVTGSSNPDFDSNFDLYMFYQWSAKTITMYFGIIVPKGARVCAALSNYDESTGSFLGLGGSESNSYLLSDSENVFCFGYWNMNNKDAYCVATHIATDYRVIDKKYYGFSWLRGGIQHVGLTNCPIVCGEDDVVKYLAGDDSVAKNQNDNFKDQKYPSESFYWDSMTCKPSVVGVVDNKNKYCFAFNYSYSCPLMLDPTEMFSCSIIYNSEIRYQDGKGRMYAMTDSKQDTFSLNKHKNGYSNNSLCLNGGFGGQSTLDAMNLLISGMLSFLPGTASSEVSKYNQYTVKSAKIYVTVFLYHVPDPDTLFSNSDIIQSAKDNMIMSTDVRSFSFDLFDLSEDKSGTEVKPTVVTEDVLDDAGNVVNKKVTDVVSNDDSGKTVINITIDNSNKVEDKNNNVNVPVNGGGGSGDSDDKNATSFWKYVTGIVAFFTALLNSDSGLFAVIASYFKFIPADFWSVTIGAIVVIAVLSIYRLAKKGG